VLLLQHHNLLLLHSDRHDTPLLYMHVACTLSVFSLVSAFF
jgi:hypothetical protein